MIDRLRRVIERYGRHSSELLGSYINRLWPQLSVVDDCIDSSGSVALGRPETHPSRASRPRGDVGCLSLLVVAPHA